MIDFLVEAETEEEAERKVTEYNDAKVQHDSSWHEFNVMRVRRVRPGVM
jgi:hypothetical protein